jgi:hypothetical protein
LSYIFGMISSHGDLGQILWQITKECLRCVRAHCTTMFIMDPAVEILTGQARFIYSYDLRGRHTYQKEEEKIAWKSFEEEKPLVLEVEDLRELFPERNPRWELTAMMTFPFVYRNKAVGVLSAASFDANHTFDEKRFRSLSGFAGLTSLAVGMADLLREANREAAWRREFEQSLDKILSRSNGCGEGK